MKKISILLILGVYLFVNKSIGQEVTNNSAAIVAKNFYFEKANIFSKVDKSEVFIKESFLKKSDTNTPLFYIYNMAPKGFVIISAQRNAFPILGYSFEGFYDDKIDNPGFRYFMNLYSRQIIEITNSKIIPDPKSEEFWNKYSDIYFTPAEKGNTKAVAPMVFSTWNQDKYYNELCPADAGGPDGHTYAGCVATALGQLMYYHRWPLSGTGSYTYNHPTYGTISADFGSSTYNWDLMTNSLTSSNLEVAKLLFHLGVSVDMDFGPNGSGMWNHKGAYTLKTYFKYCPETRYVFRDSTTLNWDSLIITNLDQKKPLYYAGWADYTFTSGHAFVCDGYQTTDFFHFNWGWGSTYDGYFYLNQLNPGGSNFNFCQELIVDIYPDTLNYTYPLYCTNGNNYNGMNGSFTDGSGILAYQPSANCSWLLNPDCGNSVNLNFDSFSLSDGDTVSVYDGPSDVSPLLVKYSTSNPPISTLKSNGNNMYVVFSSDNNLESDGFIANYGVNFCNIDTSITPSGFISDGSGNCDYDKSTNCRWIIVPPGAQSITLNFTEFDLATDNIGDYIKIYKNSISTGNLIATFNHLNPPNGPIDILAPKVIIRFVSNLTVQAGGWALDYTSSTLDIPESINYDTNNLIIFPNPVKENTIIRFNSENSNYANIRIVDLSGKQIFITNLKLSSSLSEFNMNEIINYIEPGCYLLEIETENNKYINKIIRLEEVY